MLRRRNPFPAPAMTWPVAGRHRAAMTEQDIGRSSADRTFEIRVKGRRLVRTTELSDAQWAVRAAAEAGEGAEIVDGLTGQVIERLPPQRN
jgi:hypothetical protein